MARRKKTSFDPDLEELIDYQQRYFVTILEKADFFLSTAKEQRLKLNDQNARLTRYTKSSDVVNHEEDQEITQLARRLEKAGKEIDEDLTLTEITLTGIKRKLGEAEVTMLVLKRQWPRDPVSVRCTSNKFMQETSQVEDELQTIQHPERLDSALTGRHVLLGDLEAVVRRVRASRGPASANQANLSPRTPSHSDTNIANTTNNHHHNSNSNSIDHSNNKSATRAAPKPQMQWRGDWTVDGEGGAFCKPHSDVMLHVPPAAVHAGQEVDIHVAVSADSQGIRHFLALSEDESVASPLVEFSSKTGMQDKFQQPVLMTLPHSLPADFDSRSVRVVSARRQGDTMTLASIPLRDFKNKEVPSPMKPSGYVTTSATPEQISGSTSSILNAAASQLAPPNSRSDLQANSRYDPQPHSRSDPQTPPKKSASRPPWENPHLVSWEDSDSDSELNATGFSVPKPQNSTTTSRQDFFDDKDDDTDVAYAADGLIEIRTRRPATYGVAMRQEAGAAPSLALVACGTNETMPDGKQAAQVTVYAWDLRLTIPDFQTEHGVDLSRRLDHVTVTAGDHVTASARCYSDVHVSARFDAVGADAASWRHCRGAEGSSPALPDWQTHALSKIVSCKSATCQVDAHSRPKPSPTKFEWMLETVRPSAATKVKGKPSQGLQPKWLRCVINVANAKKGENPDWTDDDVVIGRLKLAVPSSQDAGKTSGGQPTPVDSEHEDVDIHSQDPGSAQGDQSKKRPTEWHKRFIAGTVVSQLGRHLAASDWKTFVRLLPGWQSDGAYDTTADDTIRTATKDQPDKVSDQIVQCLQVWLRACPGRATRANIVRPLRLLGANWLTTHLDTLYAGQAAGFKPSIR